MKFALYIRTARGDHFLQAASTAEDLMRSQSTLVRWISQMGVHLSNPGSAMLVIAENGYGTLEAKFVAGGRRVWRSLTNVDQMLIHSADEAA